MPARKRNATVELMIEQANSFFKHSPDGAREQRKAIHGFVSTALMACNMYRGYRYLYPNERPLDHEKWTPGILFNENGEGKHEYPDDSRISFY